MRFAVALMMGLGLPMVMPAAPAHADVLCSEFMGMDEGAKMAAVQEAAAAGNAVAQISPKDAVSMAIAMCRVRVGETVLQVLNSKA
ncbi:hypothetical protein DSM43276_03026 [Mycobacteroides salmoniphilum]|uniref:hypothetical protein n=1 Tax=Mycobacteroides salmoniphilum TaxID=404941 RepID=UPI0010AAD0A5|nr:hypothetical protein [Mycobacteroides salmoniphilum]QCH24757.1 hypothetical protein DSM43276_03026 [Mycobacteroides salmoniphilum]